MAFDDVEAITYPTYDEAVEQLEAAQARIAELEAENAHLAADIAKLVKLSGDGEMVREIAKARNADVAELRAALRPFARVADRLSKIRVGSKVPGEPLRQVFENMTKDERAELEAYLRRTRELVGDG